MTRRLAAVAAVALAVAVATSACAADNGGQVLVPGTKAVIVPAQVAATAFPALRARQDVSIVQKAGLLPAGLAPSDWATSRVPATSSTLPIRLSYGSCGVDHHNETVYVNETSTRVIIDAWDGPTTGQSPVGACAGTGISVDFTVHLSRPLGSRKLFAHEIVKA